LLEAISSEHIHAPSTREGSPASISIPTQDQAEDITSSDTTEHPQSVAQDEANPPTHLPGATPDAAEGDGVRDGSTRSSTPNTQQSASTETISREDMPPFLSTVVHLSGAVDPGQTQRRRIWHLSGAITVAFITEGDDITEPPCRADEAVRICSSLRDAFVEAETNGGADTTIPTATKILQPQDRHIVSTGGYTFSPPPEFSCNSEHLFYEKDMMGSDADVLEVFSRGQNPQHWHVAKRGLGTGNNSHPVEGEVFLEVARKESTLPDVDNELATRLRKYLDER